MTSDQIEAFRGMREHEREKRRATREFSMTLLTRLAVSFVEHDGGLHLVVDRDGREADFWPSSQKWVARTPALPKNGGQGIVPMLRWLGLSTRAIDVAVRGMPS